MRILIVEDEAAIADFLDRGLRAEGFDVERAENGIAGERLALAGDADLVLLDAMLPGRDGFEVLRAIRARRGDLPVIMLTARAAVEDKVRSLDDGATDYVTKPFSFDELVARVRAHLRTPAVSDPTLLEAAGIRANLITREVERDGTAIRLAAREFDLLAHLLSRPNHAISRQQLLTEVWGFDFDPETNVVEVYIGYLRRKLGATGEPAPIETVRRVGYRLVDRG